MIVNLKRVAPLQCGKMLAAFYGALSLCFLPFMLAMMGISAIARQASPNASAPPLLMGMGIGFMILVPLFYTAIGFVGGILAAGIYNLLATWVGGFEFEFSGER